MATWVKSGPNSFRMAREYPEFFQNIPTDVYILREVQLDLKTTTLELVLSDRIGHTGKYYGDMEQRAERILSAYDSRTQNTGILLTGVKGTGKTELTKYLAKKMLGRNAATIIIDTKIDLGFVESFLEEIKQPLLVVFEEFEKNYPLKTGENDEQTGLQNKMLQLLENTPMSGKRLFVLTSNDRFGISPFLFGRTARIYYHFTYDYLELDVVQEVCKDNGLTHEQTQMVMKESLHNSFNMDALRALIVEMKRLPNQNFDDVIKYLNIDTGDSPSQIVVQPKLYKNGVLYAQKDRDKERKYHYTGKLLTLAGESLVEVNFHFDQITHCEPDSVTFESGEYKLVVTHIKTRMIFTDGSVNTKTLKTKEEEGDSMGKIIFNQMTKQNHK